MENDEYEKALTAAIVRNGSLVSENPSPYDWSEADHDHNQGWKGQRHPATCGIAKTGRVVEDATWYEFASTFEDSDTYKHGMEVHGVTCNCGRIKDRSYRWDAPVGEAIRAVMLELLGDARA